MTKKLHSRLKKDKTTNKYVYCGNCGRKTTMKHGVHSDIVYYSCPYCGYTKHIGYER